MLFRAKALRFAVPLVIGILSGWLLRDELHAVWYVFGIVCVFLCGVMLAIFRRRQSPSSRLFGLSGMLFFGVLGIMLCLRSYDATVVQWPDKSQGYQGVVVSSPRVRGLTNEYEVLLPVSGRRGERERRVSLTLLPDSTMSLPSVGDALLFFGKVSAPHNTGNPMAYDYASWQHRKGISGTVFAGRDYQLASDRLRQGLHDRLSIWQRMRIKALQYREKLVSRYSSMDLGVREYAVLSALTLGDKYALTHDIRMLFSETGASHVLALSGLHLGILVSLLLLFFRPVMRKIYGRWLAVGVCWVFIWLFTLLTGLNTSLIRAAIMYSIAMLFLVQNKQGVSLNHLALAAILILLFQPMSLMDIGFQLSFLSVFAILFFFPAYESIRPSVRWLSLATDFIYVAVVAQIATAPLVAYSFHILPLSFLLSSIVVIPCAYVLLGTTLCFFLLSAFPLLSSWVGHVIVWTARFMLGSLEVISKLPFSHVEVYPSWLTMLFCYGFVAACVFLWMKRSRNAMITAMSSFAILAGSVIHDGRPRHITSKVVIYDIPSCPAVQFIVSAKESALWMADSTQFSRVYAVAKTYWKYNHMVVPAVFTTNYSSPHIVCRQGIVSFDGKKYVLTDGSYWKDKSAGTPLDVEMLYVTTRNKYILKNLQTLFKARQTIIKPQRHQ